MIELRKGVEIGGYFLDELLATGGMGQVFTAMQPALARRVALKLIRTDIADTEEMRQRFIIEARATAAIQHPNVIHIYDVGQIDGLLYIAMELIDGPSLREVLRKEIYLGPERAVAIVCQVASGLAAAHEVGLVHRDVKPGNVLLAKHGNHEHAYLGDFGLAKVMATSGVTASGQSIGTPAYMSPEQVRSGGPVDGRADIYGLGCVLYETLTGDVPFPRDETHAIYFAHLDAEVPSACGMNSEVPTAFDDVINRALSKSPEDRFASAAEFEEACRNALRAAAELRGAAAILAQGVKPEAQPALPDVVLVWNRNRRTARIHRDGTCPTLARSVIPPRSMRFAGPGTAGWITLEEALSLIHAVPCSHCMT